MSCANDISYVSYIIYVSYMSYVSYESYMNIFMSRLKSLEVA